MTELFWTLVGIVTGSVIVHSVTKDTIEKQEKEIQHYKRLTKFYYKLAARRKIKDE